ncbi:hypothetical protein [Shimia ponticola]|uniref:hypothetical protein n=1 Tax=Shimia ponticola TaxID=2582893 RepID=UPI00164C9B2E|nr:hypothetical protein [Shimia ponticola]
MATEINAILTGDIVSSRGLSARTLETVMQDIDETADELSRDFACPVHMARYRGDGWQVWVQDGSAGLRAALRILTRLGGTGQSTRIAMAVGEATLPASGDLAAAYGPAFEAAGDALEQMPRHRRMSIAATAGPWPLALLEVIDFQARQWTKAQNAALYHALARQDVTQAEIANRFGVSQQAIQDRLAGAGLRALNAALDVFEAEIVK